MLTLVGGSFDDGTQRHRVACRLGGDGGQPAHHEHRVARRPAGCELPLAAGRIAEAEQAADGVCARLIRRLHQQHEELDAEQIRDKVLDAVDALFADKEAQVGGDTMRMLEKHVMLNVLDQNWKEHLGRMDYLRQGIHLRGYAQKNPKQEYKREAFKLFEELLENVKYEVVRFLSKVQVRSEDEVEALERQQREAQEREAQGARYVHAEAPELVPGEEPAGETAQVAAPAPFVRDMPKVGRNEPCPCGSGKKYKQCHGQIA